MPCLAFRLNRRDYVRGASGGNRTHDKLITNQLLYRLSYAGIEYRFRQSTLCKNRLIYRPHSFTQDDTSKKDACQTNDTAR